MLREQERENTKIQARATTLMSPRVKMGIAIALALSGLVWLIYFMFVGSTVEFKSVAAIADQPPTPEGRLVGMRGKLVPGTFIREPDGIAARFSMIDEGGELHIPVRYSGDLPGLLFNEHSEIIVQGHKDHSGLFSAEILTVKCPSKYQVISDQGDNAPYEENSKQETSALTEG